MTPHPNTPATVEIFGQTITRIEYRGQQVVTYDQIDKLHGRKGAAKSSHHENRERFEDGVDCILVPASQKLEFRTFGIEVPNRGLMVFTQRGYLKITRSFKDDKSWAIFDEMLDRYFLVKEVIDRFDFDASGQGELGLDPEGIRIFRSEMTRNASGLARNIESIKQALLGYFHKAVQTSITAMSSELSDVHRMSHKGFNTINNNVKAVDAKLDRLEAHFGPAGAQPLGRPADWYTISRIYEDIAKVTGIPRQGFLSSAVKTSLESFTLRQHMNFHMDEMLVSGRQVKVWHIDVVRPWFEQHGRQMIAEHIARNTPKAPVLTLVKTDEPVQ
jgi:hypothetical protein